MALTSRLGGDDDGGAGADAGADDALVQRTHHRHVVELCFNRPHRLNALDERLYRRTAAALHALGSDRTTRVIVLTATGTRSFCSGMDVKAVRTKQRALSTVRAARQFMHALINCPKIVVAAVFGRVVGIGVTMLLHCDFVYCHPLTTFQTPFYLLGIVPEFASSVTFPLFLGKQLAARLLLGAHVVDASTMRDAGVCDIVQQPDVQSTVVRRCTEWSHQANDAQWASISTAKQLIKQSTNQIVQSAMRAELDQIEHDVQNESTSKLLRSPATLLKSKL